MPDLMKRLTEDLKIAMKNEQAIEIATLKLLLAAIHNKEIEKRTKLSKQISDFKELEEKSHLTDEEIIEVISSEVKKRKDSITAYETTRPDLAKQEERELEALRKYAPKELSEQEIRVIVKVKISDLGAAGIGDLGKVMSKVTPETKGRADGTVVKKIVEEELNSK